MVTPVVQHRPVAMATPVSNPGSCIQHASDSFVDPQVTTPQTVYREVRPRPSAPAVAT